MQNEWPIAFQSPVTPSAQVCKMSELQSLPLFPPPSAMEPEIHTFHIFFENYLLQLLPSRYF